MPKKEKKETSEKQIKANQKNARKSSGPKTAEGKKFASKNAVKHGLYSDDIIIKSATFSEDADQYEALVRSLFDELRPRGVLQEELVLKVANCMWRSRRVVRAETAHINERMDDIDRDVRDAADNKKWRSGLDHDVDDTELTPEERARAVENGIGQRVIPDDETARYILRFEMRLDRQMSRALKELRILQMTPKVKRKPRQESVTSPVGQEPCAPDFLLCDQAAFSGADREVCRPQHNHGGSEDGTALPENSPNRADRRQASRPTPPKTTGTNPFDNSDKSPLERGGLAGDGVCRTQITKNEGTEPFDPDSMDNDPTLIPLSEAVRREREQNGARQDE